MVSRPFPGKINVTVVMFDKYSDLDSCKLTTNVSTRVTTEQYNSTTDPLSYHIIDSEFAVLSRQVSTYKIQIKIQNRKQKFKLIDFLSNFSLKKKLVTIAV